MAAVEFLRKEYQKAVLGAVNLDHQVDGVNGNSLKELKALATTAGAEVVGEVSQRRESPNSTYYFGKGKVNEIRQLVRDTDANLFIFDDDLTPAQVRNLEERLEIPVVDRSGLILDIFALHAHTVESRVQVKLAQLKYLLPRLAGRWSHLERQEGAIGTRGPGETQLETDRRLITKEISELEKKLEQIDRERATQRKRRKNLFKVTLVGYTNSGKSTILNRMTDADVLAENKLFATLDSTTRRLALGNGEIALLTDTVGFISKLPAHLAASFRSTLVDVQDADLLLHVVDAADSRLDQKIATVNQELSEICSDKVRTVMVFNKIDLLNDGQEAEDIKRRFPGAIFVSALNSSGLEFITGMLKREHGKFTSELIIRIEQEQYPILAELSKTGRITNTSSEGDSIIVRFVGSREAADRIMRKYPQLGITPVVS